MDKTVDFEIHIAILIIATSYSFVHINKHTVEPPLSPPPLLKV